VTTSKYAFALKVTNGWKLREAISLAPWLQPGDPKAISTAANRFNSFTEARPKTVETVRG
jgi:hypothetical protein